MKKYFLGHWWTYQEAVTSLILKPAIDLIYLAILFGYSIDIIMGLII
jgi:hypothetical protein